MSTQQPPAPHVDRYVVIHVATTCDEHGVYVTKDSAEVIELGWILLDAKSLDEVSSSSIVPREAEAPWLGLLTRLHCATAAPRERACQAYQYTNHSTLQ